MDEGVVDVAAKLVAPGAGGPAGGRAGEFVDGSRPLMFVSVRPNQDAEVFGLESKVHG